MNNDRGESRKPFAAGIEISSAQDLNRNIGWAARVWELRWGYVRMGRQLALQDPPIRPRTLPTEGGGRVPSSDVPPAVKFHGKTMTAATSNYHLAGAAVEGGSE
jgi:hypothetical protein